MAKKRKLCVVTAQLQTRKQSIGGKEKFANEHHKMLQKLDAFDGFEKVFIPAVDDPNATKMVSGNDSKRVQANARLLVEKAFDALGELINIIATQDEGNTQARADLVVDGKIILKNKPATTYLMLGKQLDNMAAVIRSIIPLPLGYEWVYDPNFGHFRTRNTVKQDRTAAVEEALVLLQPTKEHPGQAQRVTRQYRIGAYETTYYHSGLPKDVIDAMLDLVQKYSDAAKEALYEANTKEVEDIDVASPVASAILQPMTDFFSRAVQQGANAS